MRRLWSRLVAWAFPPEDPHAIAALDGGPGPEHSRPVKLRVMRLDTDGRTVVGEPIVGVANVVIHHTPPPTAPCVRVRDVGADQPIRVHGPTMVDGILTPYGRYLLADHPVAIPPHPRHPVLPPTGDPDAEPC